MELMSNCKLFLTNKIFSKEDLKDIPDLTEKSAIPKSFYPTEQIINSDIVKNTSIGILNNILININFIKEQLTNIENVGDFFRLKIYKSIQDA